MTKGEVVPFPFRPRRRAPAVCLTDPFGRYRHVVLAFVTGRLPLESAATDVILREEDPDSSRQD